MSSAGEPPAHLPSPGAIEPRADVEEALSAPEPKRLDFHLGAPVVPIRLMEGVTEVSFSGRGRIRMLAPGPVDKTVEGPGGSRWSVHLVESAPAVSVIRLQLADLPFDDAAGLEVERALWSSRGLRAVTRTIGSIYGIAGKVVDNRRTLLLLDEEDNAATARERQAEVLHAWSVRAALFEDVVRPAGGRLELRDAEGRPIALAQDRLLVHPLDGAPFDVRAVEFGVGYPFHGHEDRSYRGDLEVTIDRSGKLAVVNRVTLEDLLKGLVPAEIYPRAPADALKAQAVTARGEVLAKIGLKHLADPYLLCSEQHCAVYRGMSGEAATTNQAVEQTRGEGLFGRSGRLVDSVYSATCGGHTEDNEVVWGGAPNDNLRGRPDTLPGRTTSVSPDDLQAFLTQELPTACRLSSLSAPSKYRWERRFTAEEVNRLTAGYGLGPIQAIGVSERGVSGRARVMTLSGELGATQVRGELNIRRLFGMLNSAMFLVEAERGADRRLTGWVFRGGGWGHGVGLCQTGAIGRAEAGQSYRAILGHYFNGAEVARIY